LCVFGSHTYKGQAAGGELDLIVLIGGAEERAAIKWEKSMEMRKRGGEKIFGITWREKNMTKEVLAR
jgi:hypothetical protein